MVVDGIILAQDVHPAIGNELVILMIYNVSNSIEQQHTKKVDDG